MDRRDRRNSFRRAVTAWAITVLGLCSAAAQSAAPTVTYTAGGVTLYPRQGPVWHWQLRWVGTSAGPAGGVDCGPTEPLIRPDGVIEYHRGDLIEQYVPREDTVEQQFVIPEPLDLGGGDLHIGGSVRCAADRFGRSGHEWVWSDSSGGVLLGDVHAYDARGTAIPARLTVWSTGTEVQIRAAALAAASYPLLIDPQIGEDDFRVSTTGPEGAQGFDVSDPDVAYNPIDDEYLVVWAADLRSSTAQAPDVEILARRIDADTAAFIGGAFRISDMGPVALAVFFAAQPAVVHNAADNEYLVVWQGSDDTEPLIAGELEIFGQRLSGGGLEIGPNDFRISDLGPDAAPGYDATEPALAYNSADHEYLVIWSGNDELPGQSSTAREIFGQRIVGGTGVEIGTNDFCISETAAGDDPSGQARHPAVAYNPTANEYLVLWDGDAPLPLEPDGVSRIHGRRLQAATGRPVDANDRLVLSFDTGAGTAVPAIDPSITYNSVTDEYFVVFGVQDTTVNGWEDEVYGRRLSAAGQPLGSAPVRISDMGPNGDGNLDARSPRVVHSAASNEYLVVWRGDDDTEPLIDNEREIFGQRLDAAGQEIGFNDFRLSRLGPDSDAAFDADQPAAAMSGTANEYLVVWRGDDDRGLQRDNDFEIFAQRYTIAAMVSIVDSPSEATAWGEPIEIAFTVDVPIGAATGTVTVTAGSDSCSANVATGRCALTPSVAGELLLVAAYGGDRNYGRAASDPLVHTVLPPAVTVEIISYQPDPSDSETAVLVEYVVTPDLLDGTVTVSDGQVSCSGTTAEGGCTLTFAGGGPKLITASYEDPTGELTGVSEPQLHTVRFATVTAITAHTPEPTAVGDAILIAFAVTADGAEPQGLVTVSAGDNSCSATVAEGTCLLIITEVGDATLIARYEGTSAFRPSASAPLTHRLVPAAEPPAQNDPETANPCTLDPGALLPVLSLTLLAAGWMRRRVQI